MRSPPEKKFNVNTKLIMLVIVAAAIGANAAATSPANHYDVVGLGLAPGAGPPELVDNNTPFADNAINVLVVPSGHCEKIDRIRSDGLDANTGTTGLALNDDGSASPSNNMAYTTSLGNTGNLMEQSAITATTGADYYESTPDPASGHRNIGYTTVGTAPPGAGRDDLTS